MEFLKKQFSIILISISVIITGLILGRSYLAKGKADPKINVVGMGEETFDSDLIVWNASFSRNDYELKTAYFSLNQDLKELKNYLKKKGVSEKDVIIEAANIEKQYSYDYDDEGNMIWVGNQGEAAVAYRGLFLIDKNGIVRHQVVNDLPLGRSVDETLRMVDALQYFEANGEVCPADWSKGKDALKDTAEGIASYLATH